MAVTAALAGAPGPASAEEVRIKYLYGLADLDGPVRHLGSRVRVDAVNEEILLLGGSSVRIFNASAMEIYSFKLEPDMGHVFDVAAEPTGDLLLACAVRREERLTFVIRRCDYRGRPKDEIVPALPEGLAGFLPTSMQMRDGLLFFLSPMQLEMVVLGTDGSFVRHVDLAELLDVEEDEKGSLEIGGFGFDAAGNAVFTIPGRYRAVVVGPDWRVLRGFGRRGSSPGRFSVVAGVQGDDRGNLFVADKGRNVVLVFDRDLEFVTEFGGYGDQPENLVRPDHLAWFPGGRLLVTQMKHRGVSVFDVASQ